MIQEALLKLIEKTDEELDTWLEKTDVEDIRKLLTETYKVLSAYETALYSACTDMLEPLVAEKVQDYIKDGMESVEIVLQEGDSSES